MNRLLRVEWDAIAGIVAALAALIMHFLHILEINVLLMIFGVLMALLFIRDLRREHFTERIDASLERTEAAIKVLQANLVPPDAILVGSRQLRAVTEGFSTRASGEMVWFHVCLLMFKPKSLFNTLLRPAIENPRVTSIQFILDQTQQELWHQEVRPCWTDQSESSGRTNPCRAGTSRLPTSLRCDHQPLMPYRILRAPISWLLHNQSPGQPLGLSSNGITLC